MTDRPIRPLLSRDAQPPFPLPLRLVLVHLDDGTSRWVDPADLEPFTERDPTGDPICEEDT